jgi:hypothetical protein
MNFSRLLNSLTPSDKIDACLAAGTSRLETAYEPACFFGWGRRQTVNISVEEETRIAFRDWLRGKLKELEFYNRRGDHYLIREFHKYCDEAGYPIDEASLGRYLRDENPVIPTPDRCRALGGVFKMPAIDVMIAAGLVKQEDMKVVA